MTDMKTSLIEEWRPVVGYEGYYEVSNLGEVRSVSRLIERKKKSENAHNTGNRMMDGRILAQYEQKPPLMNYRRVHLSVEHKAKSYKVHRLVAEAFIPKPKGCDIINHIDNDPTNNRVDNLEWTTPKGNMQHKIKQGRYSLNGTIAMQEKNKKPVMRIDDYGNTKLYNSAREAAKDMGLKNATSISQACLGRIKTSKGYRWQYVCG